MKFTLLITSFALLQPVVLSGILRGQTKLDKKKQSHRKLSGTGNSGGGNNMQGGSGGGNCPPTVAKGGLAAGGFTACSYGSDCTAACSGQGAGCCCVAGATGLGHYCGVPSDCNNFLYCVPEVAPTPSPTSDDRGIGGPGGVIDGITVDANGCIAVSQEWCSIQNQCVLAGTCNATAVDANGCAVGSAAVDGPEAFCVSRNDCILDQLWSCPMVNPTALCPYKQIVPVTITDHNGNSYTPSNGQVHYATENTPTQVRARVLEGLDGLFVGEIDFTILNDEYGLYIPNAGACAPIYNVVVYFTDSLRHVFHICYEDPFNNVPAGNPNAYGIRQCNLNPQADAQSVQTWFRLEMFAFGNP